MCYNSTNGLIKPYWNEFSLGQRNGVYMFAIMEQYASSVGLAAVIVSSVWGFSLWLSKQFNSLKDRIDAKAEKTDLKIEQLEQVFLNKLDYHEKHDDKRFANINDSLWELRLRNAAASGILAETKKALEKK